MSKSSTNSDIKKRLDIIIQKLQKSGRAFSKTCGFSESYYATINDGIGADKISKIISAYPQVSAHWLLTGEGEMFLPETTEAAAKSGGDEILRELIREKDSRIENLIRENERLRIEINTLRNGPEPVA